jgi:hypothetical protein
MAAPEQQKAAILYGLYQQPQFRQMIKDAAPDILKEDKDGKVK